MALSCRLHPSLCGALVALAIVAMAMIAIMVAAVTVIQEVVLLRWGNVMPLCDAKNARVSVANNAGTGATAEQLACTCATLRGK